MAKANEQWLREYRKRHPDRVHDPNDPAPDRDDVMVVRAVEWTFDGVVPPTYNEIMRLYKHRQHEYYAILDRWTERIAVRARQTFGPSYRFLLPVEITMVRHSTGKIDVDGLYGTFKIPLDALVRAGVIPDDNPDAVQSIRPEHVRADEPKTTIRIKSVTTR